MQARRMALGGSLSALAAAVLFLGSFLPLATFCAPVLAMVILLPIQEECGPRFAWAAWGAVSVLALLLAADREMALVYGFFGWYPILRPRIARLRSRLLRLICRLAVCDGLIALLYGAVLALLAPEAAFSGSGLLTAGTLLCGNVLFLLLDRVLGRFTLLWRRALYRLF